MDASPETPELADAPPRRRWQFSLGMLIWLMTAAAAIAALVRFAAEDPCIRFALIGYLLLLSAVAVVRLPVFFGELQRIREHRRQLLKWADAKRKAVRAQRVSNDEWTASKQ